jgi:uncharacterized membrane protein YjjP (DUF1212 family)
MDLLAGFFAGTVGLFLWKRLADKDPIIRVMVTFGAAILVLAVALFMTHYHP